MDLTLILRPVHMFINGHLNEVNISLSEVSIHVPVCSLCCPWVSIRYLSYFVYFGYKHFRGLWYAWTQVTHFNGFNKPNRRGRFGTQVVSPEVAVFYWPLSRICFLLFTVLPVGFECPRHDVIIIVIEICKARNGPKKGHEFNCKNRTIGLTFNTNTQPPKE